MDWNAQCPKATGTCNMILRRILTEIFHGVNHFGAVLHLFKNDKSLFGQELLTACQHQILQNPIRILRGFKKLFVFFVLIEVEVGCIFIIASAKLFENPCLACLAYSFQDQRLTVGRVLPLDKFIHIHHTDSHFYW